jgi:hypothetical protein
MSKTDVLAQYDEQAIHSLAYLQSRCYTQASAKGFWDDEPERHSSDLQHYQGNKLMLMVSELVEAHEELRKGHPVTQTYYPTKPTGDLEAAVVHPARVDGIYKPEGVPSELADAVIRAFDFAGKYDIDLGQMIFEKLRYNASRPFKHGKQF